MSSWITDASGKWHPALEKVSLTNHGPAFKHPKSGDIVETGDPYIYEGPCRAALFDLWQIDKTGNTTTLSGDFRSSPGFLATYGHMRNTLGFKDVAEYLSYLGYDEASAKKRFAEKSSELKRHELPRRMAEINKLGGGRDHSGMGNDTYGGFGEPAEMAVTKG